MSREDAYSKNASRRLVDQLTLPHLFAPWALVPVTDTRETLVATSLFP